MFALENFYEGMREGEDPYAGMSYDVSSRNRVAIRPTVHPTTAMCAMQEWLAANPVHPKWIARLQRDDDELHAQQRLR